MIWGRKIQEQELLPSDAIAGTLWITGQKTSNWEANVGTEGCLMLKKAKVKWLGNTS